MSKTIHQTVIFNVPPHEVYEALMDSNKHSQFTGEPAAISREVGGEFSAYSDYISGKNLELVPDRKIVQAWHASDWPEGFTSRITYHLTRVAKGTRLDFTHEGLPDGTEAEFTQGWIDNYWDKLQEYFDKSKK